jgi:predicted acyl esterase
MTRDMNNYDVIYPDPVPDGVVLEKNVYAKMRDGIEVAMDIYKPAEGKGPWPAIIGYSGYKKEFFFESALPEFYCPRGYVLVQLQARGSGYSQGQFCFHGENEAKDGYDTVEWLAKQPWCNGNVGMMGASYFGVNQWATAIQNPPHLKCIVPCPGTTDNYRGMIYPGGVFRSSFVVYIVSRILQETIWPGPVQGKELPENIISQLFAQTEDGPYYWEHGGAWRHMDKIQVPVLTIAPGANDLHITQHLSHYNEITSPKKLIVSPWAGTRYQPFIFDTTAINQYLIRWFDYWLKGINTGIMDEPEVAIFDNGTGKWRYENEYPLERTQWKKFYLQKRTSSTVPWGTLRENLPDKDERPDSFKHPPAKRRIPGSFNFFPDSDNREFLAYTTPPLDEDITIKGPVSMTIYVSTTEETPSDWAFFVKVGEIGPDGAALNPVTKEPHLRPDWTDAWTPKEVNLWSYGNLKTKFREVDEAKSKPGHPWHPFTNPELLKPNTIYEFQIELVPIFNTFKKGHKIWVQIACDDEDYNPWDAASSYVMGPPPLSASVSVYHDTERPSHLLLPLIPDAPETARVESPLCDFVPGASRFGTRG